jgi:DNA adenine methylase
MTTLSAIKWVGGKRQLFKTLDSVFPQKIKNFIEPFGGSLSVSLHVLTKYDVGTIHVADINKKLINFYEQIRMDVDEVVGHLRRFIAADDYYMARNAFNSVTDPIDSAALFFYINKSCYNGLYRVNLKGGFNVPKGRNNINWDNQIEHLREFATNIQSSKLHLYNMGYETFMEQFTFSEGDLVYADPPYWDTFVAYDGHGFKQEDQEKLYDICSNINCTVVCSNSNTDFIKELYSPTFSIREVDATRSINSDKTKRGKAKVEVIMKKMYENNVRM